MQIDEMRVVLATARWNLLALRNVVAVGIGYKVRRGQRTDQPAIVCSVLAKRPPGALAAVDLVPTQVSGIATDVVATGAIFASSEHKSRHRPAPGGVSIGHIGITAGTLGCVVRRDGQLHILSNNHVLANSNDAVVGDAILQPGPADGGRGPDDQIGRLAAFVPIVFDQANGLPPASPCPTAGFIADALNTVASAIGSGTRLRAVRLADRVAARPAAAAAENLVDAAVATPDEDRLVAREILGIGPIRGIGEAALGTPLKKSGRTTELTTGAVLQTDVTVRVSYGTGRVATFTDQLLAGAMSQGGDSGSAVLDDQDRITGLLFAGSNTTTVINRIQHVFASLSLSLP
jgi:hypothetical protein